MKREFRKLFFVIRDLKVLRDPRRTLTDIRNFTNLFFVILRHEFSERLESSIVSDLGMRFAIRSLDFSSLSRFHIAFSRHSV